MEESCLSRIRNRATKRVDWLAIGLSFIFIGVIPPEGDNPMTLIQIVALIIGVGMIIGALLLRMSNEIPAFPRAYKKSSVVWGLWHSGGRTRRNRLHSGYHSLKQILLLDPYNKEFQTYFEEYLDTPEQARGDITTLTREAVKLGITVKWYAKMQSHALTFFNPESKDGWVVVEEHTPLVSCNDRPRKLLRRSAVEYASALTKYQKLWDISRLPNPNEYGG